MQDTGSFEVCHYLAVLQCGINDIQSTNVIHYQTLGVSRALKGLQQVVGTSYLKKGYNYNASRVV